MKSVAARWPTAVDYQTALQAPSLCFKDPALRQGSVYTNALGLPAVATGNVVVVFRMRLGDREVAVRCFTRKVSFEPLVRRYEALSQHLKQVDLPVLVPSTYHPDQILVDEVYYPIVQMPWLPGLSLNRYIEKHLHEPQALGRLAGQWRTLMAQLRAARFAHGDLSDGNVLVDDQGLIHLIDYDAAYVPALGDQPPGEVGKPNYQHPERLDAKGPEYGYYGPNVDAFASLVIYLTLRALADDASRWRCYHTGENLIFDQEDFQNPGYTPIWLDLRNGNSDEVKRLSDVLEDYCRASVAQLPYLEDALRGRRPPRRVRKMEAVTVAEDRLPSYALQADGQGVVVDVGTASVRPSGVRTWLRWPQLALVGVVVALVVALLFVVRGVQRDASAGISLSPPPEMTTAYLDPGALPGFYTGYATSLEGSREPMALIIDSLEVFPDIREAFFSYTVNWKAHNASGVGRYNLDTGHIDLESHYVLFVSRATEGEVVLSSLSHLEQRPLVMVNKRLLQ